MSPYKKEKNGLDKLFADICVSLIKDKLEELVRTENKVSDVCLYLDGEKSSAEKRYVREYTSKVSKLSIQKIHLVDGGDLDRRCNIVNLADAIAFHISTRIEKRKKLSQEVLRHKKQLIKVA